MSGMLRYLTPGCLNVCGKVSYRSVAPSEEAVLILVRLTSEASHGNPPILKLWPSPDHTTSFFGEGFGLYTHPIIPFGVRDAVGS